MSKVNIVLDASKYDLFLTCPTRYNYRHNLNKDLPVKNQFLDRGTVIHVGCETYYQALKDGAKYDYAVNSAMLSLKTALVKSDLSDDKGDQIIRTMEEYFDHWRVADQSFEIVEVEKPFMYLLHEDDDVRIYMSGKIDLLFNDNRYTNMPLDHKSFERSGEVNRMSNQFKNYCVAVNSNYLLVNRIGLQKTLKPHEKFLRVPVSYDHVLLEEWKLNVIKNVMYYLQCAAENSWPMNETSCDKYNRRCEYYEICDSSGQEAKLFKLENNFVTVDAWDVTKILKKSSEVLKNDV